MIRHKVTMHIRGFQHLHSGIIVGLDRPPASMQEVISPRMDFTPGGNAGKTSGITTVEGYALFRKSLEVRRYFFIPAVGGKIVSI
jgi:hypothetical protein